MSFQLACRPATGIEKSLHNQTIVYWRKLRAPQSLNLAHPKVDFSPPGMLVRMKCVHACACMRAFQIRGNQLRDPL